MQLNIQQEDPFKILSSTKVIVENLQHIKINEENLNSISNKIEEKLNQGLNVYEIGFGTAKNYEEDVQLIFLEDVVNFCFWSEKDKPLWRVKSPEGEIPSGGWFSLVNCFKRAIIGKKLILNTEFLTSVTLPEVIELFKGIDGINIPLVRKRMDNLHEAGTVLKNKFSGKFINLLIQANYDAIKLIKLIYENFDSFKDVATMDGKNIYFLKRAQILVQDLSYLTQKYKRKNIGNFHLLTAFADYKLPQMLRKYGVIEYKNDLAEKVDKYTLIPAGSREEIEIRSVTIWCIELIRQKLGKYTAADVDNALWLISQNQTDVKPYHRTYTIFY